MASLQPSPASASASALPRLRAAPVTRATLPRMPRSITSPALELRLALAEEGLDALGGVLALERRHERVDLDVDRARHRRLQPLVDGLDDGGHRERRALAELPRQRAGVVQRLALLAEPVDQAELEALLGGDLRAQQEELERLRAADQPRQPLGAAVARDDAEVRLRLAHPRRLLEQAQVAGHRDLTAAAHRV